MKKLYITFIVLLVIGIGGGIYYFTGYRQAQMDFPKEVVMETSKGESYSFNKLKPKVRLLEFMYVNCPDVCPNTTYQMVSIRDKLVEDGLFGQKVEFLTVTLDPARDSLQALDQYGQSFKVDKTKGWYLLRGSAKDTRTLADSFNFLYNDPGTGYLVHTSSTYLLDEKNRVIKIFGMGDEGFDKEKVYKEIVKAAKDM